MLTFKTQFPLNSNNSTDDLFEVGRIWLSGSPHSTLAKAMATASGINDEWHRESDNETIRFISYKSGEQLSALRHENLDPDNRRWVTEVACAKISEKLWISVQLSVDSELPVEKIESGKRPHIIKTIMKKIGGGMDGRLQVSDKPIYLKSDQICLAADIITADADCLMPVVYISADEKGNKHVDPNQLAHWLAGMAHVLVEPHRSFSFLRKCSPGLA